MYNLLCFGVNWNEKVVRIPRSRVFERTDERICERFKPLGKIDLEAIKELPCIFCNEGTDNESIYVGYIQHMNIVGDYYSVEVNFDTSIHGLKNRRVHELRSRLCIEDYELNRSHWAIKNIDLYKFLFQNSSSLRHTPKVFKISPFESVEEGLVALMMPFDAGFGAVHKVITDAMIEIGLECKRADDIWEDDSIIQDIVSLIDRSRVVICDCTGRNPNVFYEAGIAHTLGREVIVITQSEHDVPFDLRHIRHIQYLKNEQGLGDLAEQIKSRVQNLIDR